jgi:hypothetical protein
MSQACVFLHQHAVLAQLRHPPPGFEGAVKEHFRSVRPQLRRQCAAWLADMAGDMHQASMTQIVQEVNAELDNL